MAQFIRIDDHIINLEKVHHIEHDDGTIHFFFKKKQVIVDANFEDICSYIDFPKETTRRYKK